MTSRVHLLLPSFARTRSPQNLQPDGTWSSVRHAAKMKDETVDRDNTNYVRRRYNGEREIPLKRYATWRAAATVALLSGRARILKHPLLLLSLPHATMILVVSVLPHARIIALDLSR